ncbi:MAG TPA: hypothetical protein VG271_03225 [Beijerinckiaceae bacterium]|nr:hypothetical protein [Beijerinckiaceae bacterium]
MTALGLSSDAKLLARAGGRVTIAIVASTALLVLLSVVVVSVN